MSLGTTVRCFERRPVKDAGENPGGDVWKKAHDQTHGKAEHEEYERLKQQMSARDDGDDDSLLSAEDDPYGTEDKHEKEVIEWGDVDPEVRRRAHMLAKSLGRSPDDCFTIAVLTMTEDPDGIQFTENGPQEKAKTLAHDDVEIPPTQTVASEAPEPAQSVLPTSADTAGLRRVERSSGKTQGTRSRGPKSRNTRRFP